MKARYHKFTGSVPVVFVEDVSKFIKSMGIQVSEDNNKVVPDFMHEISVGGIPMLVFSESLLRTLYGSRVTPVIESHLAIWKGLQRHPGDTFKAYRHAMAIAERYNRPKCHEILRLKLSELTKIELPKMEPKNSSGSKKQSVESILFTENAKRHNIKLK